MGRAFHCRMLCDGNKYVNWRVYHLTTVLRKVGNGESRRNRTITRAYPRRNLEPIAYPSDFPSASDGSQFSEAPPANICPPSSTTSHGTPSCQQNRAVADAVTRVVSMLASMWVGPKQNMWCDLFSGEITKAWRETREPGYSFGDLTEF